jgi:hypothetical protein
VLTKASIESAESQALETQAGPERRQWLCVSTRIGVDVCTAHLASPEADEVAANNPQCAELSAILARRAAIGTVIFGATSTVALPAPRPASGRAPTGPRTRIPGVNRSTETGVFRSPSALVVPAIHTDHDVLLVRAHLTAQR